MMMLLFSVSIKYDNNAIFILIVSLWTWRVGAIANRRHNNKLIRRGVKTSATTSGSLLISALVMPLEELFASICAWF